MCLTVLLMVLSLALPAGATPVSPTRAIAFEYLFWADGTGTWANPRIDDDYGFSCTTGSKSYQLGAWLKANNYSGVVLDVGNPIVFAGMRKTYSDYATFFGTSYPTTQRENARTWLAAMYNCVRQGSGSSVVVYLGFTNDTGVDFKAAGSLAGQWAAAMGNAYPWVNFEGEWNSVSSSIEEMKSFKSTMTYGFWSDSSINWDYWSYDELKTYVSAVSSSYGGMTNFLYPQNYNLNINHCWNYPINQPGDSACAAENTPWIGTYVTGVTVQTGQSTSESQMWSDYVAQNYPNGGANVVIVMAWNPNDLQTYSAWSSYR